MIGIMLNHRESHEFVYLLKKELDEMLLDLKDGSLDRTVRDAIKERYKVIFRIFARMATPQELSKYALSRNKIPSPN